MTPLPIRWKFALWTVGSTTVAVLVFAAGTLVTLYHEQLASIDLEIASEAQALATRRAGARGGNGPAGIDFHPSMAYAVFGRDGALVQGSPRLDEATARLALAARHLRSYRASSANWRLGVFPLEGDQQAVVGYNLQEIRELVDDLLFSYAVSLPFVLFAAAAGGLWVARRALRPVRHLADAAAAVDPERLDVRVPEPAAQDEMQKLARAMNAMLGRIEQAFTQTRRFAADASHELRTPLTIMRAEVEQLLRTPAGGAALEEKLLSLQVEISRLDRITEHLLLLARFDAGQVHPPAKVVDFAAIVHEACEDAELIATTQSVTLACEAQCHAAVMGDEIMLRRLVLNLLDNAVRHNEHGGRVECRVGGEGDAVLLRVRNTGPGISPPARAELFQRFFRADPARSRGGHGLGLALCREIARSHRGDVECVESETGWTEFVVRLPAAPAGPSPHGAGSVPD